MSDDDLALFLTKAAATYYGRRTFVYAPVLMDEAIKELDAPGLLSAKAIGAIVGCDEGHVLRVVGRSTSRPRGKLNPAHISWLGYTLSAKEIKPEILREMLKTGTSLSTIADLTNISQATLYRWRKNG